LDRLANKLRDGFDPRLGRCVLYYFGVEIPLDQFGEPAVTVYRNDQRSSAKRNRITVDRQDGQSFATGLAA